MPKKYPFWIRFNQPAGEGGGDPATAPDEVSADEPDDKVEGEDALGDPGKKALDAMKADRKAALDRAKAAEDELAKIKAENDGKAAEYEAEKAAQKVRDDALAVANSRIVKSEVKAAAARKLADPNDALKFIDLEQFEVGEDGEVDASAITKAVDDLVSSKPYLAAQGGGAIFESPKGFRQEATSEAQALEKELEQAQKSRNFQRAVEIKQRLAELSKKKP